uniref:Ephrin-A4-like n=1 Tax=Sinocyclocheilus grahami TaxID=75366 RepID=A0A672KWD1_SINGR
KQLLSFHEKCSGVCAMMRLLALFIHVMSTTAKRHVVYWNSTNTRLTGDDYSVQVNLSDYLDILCPHYPADHPSSGPVDTLALYLVAEGQFRGCVETKEAIKRWECNQPYAPYGPVRFSEKIQRFTPFSLGFEFLPGHHYYYSCKYSNFNFYYPGEQEPVSAFVFICMCIL